MAEQNQPEPTDTLDLLLSTGIQDSQQQPRSSADSPSDQQLTPSGMAGQQTDEGRDLLNVLKKLLDDSMGALETRLGGRMEALETRLGGRMDALDNLVNSLMHEVSSFGERIKAVESSNPPLMDADIDAVVAELSLVYEKVMTLTNNAHLSIVDVADMSSNVCRMVEISWTLLLYVAANLRPEPFKRTPSALQFEPRHSAVDAKYKPLKPIKGPSAMPNQGRDAFVELMTRLTPQWHANQERIIYTSLSWWMLALRSARDMGLHRTLSNIVPAPPAPTVSPSSLGSVAVTFPSSYFSASALMIKLPINPVYDCDGSESRLDPPSAFATPGTKFEVHQLMRGFCWVGIDKMVAGVREVASVLHDGFSDVMNQCKRPTAAVDAP